MHVKQAMHVKQDSSSCEAYTSLDLSLHVVGLVCRYSLFLTICSIECDANDIGTVAEWVGPSLSVLKKCPVVSCSLQFAGISLLGSVGCAQSSSSYDVSPAYKRMQKSTFLFSTSRQSAVPRVAPSSKLARYSF